MPSPISKNDWQVQNRVWGFTGTQTHGGVIDDNVTFDEEGNLILIANGDWYAGDKQGIVASSDISVTGGQRTGAAVKSVKTYGPGSFEVVMKVPQFNGICTAFWLYNYVQSSQAGVDANNYEIDIEVHGTTSSNQGNLSTPLFTTWVTEKQFVSKYYNLGYSLADGNFHTFRIDWHTGDSPYVNYYVDGVLVMTHTDKVPTNEMYVNIGCWFPDSWCGVPNFETDYAVVKSFSYTPFEGETATKLNCNQIEAGGFLDGVTTPKQNYFANGEFNYSLDSSKAFSVEGTASVSGGKLVFSGTVSQTVSMDLFGNVYDLMVDGDTDITVTVTYIDVKSGSALGEALTFKAGSPIKLNTPKNATGIKIQLSSESSCTVNSVKLTKSK